MSTTTPNSALSDTELLLEIKRLSSKERQATARLVAALGELDARRLYLAEGCSSLFTYCTEVLHFSEHAAYLRIEAARAARKWPAIVARLADGSVHLTAVSLLAPHLTEQNHCDILAAARHKSKRAVEEIVAAVRPKPPVPSSVRRLPAPTATLRTVFDDQPGPSPLPAVPAGAPVVLAESSVGTTRARRPHDVTPLAPERYKVQFTVSQETHDRLREAQELLRHSIPDGDVAAIFERALTRLLTDLRRTRQGKTDRPRPSQREGSRGRHIPAAVKREVWTRDAGRCAFVGNQGRCTERSFLEYHHVVPHVDGGDTTAQNIELRCRPHNAYEAQRWAGFGEEDTVREAPASFVVIG